MSKLTDELVNFIKAEKWTFAKTMPEWPHEYIVRERVDEQLFLKEVPRRWGVKNLRYFFKIRSKNVLSSNALIQYQ